jgi:hypothetical protein
MFMVISKVEKAKRKQSGLGLRCWAQMLEMELHNLSEGCIALLGFKAGCRQATSHLRSGDLAGYSFWPRREQIKMACLQIS